jgi:hypothetical protein
MMEAGLGDGNSYEKNGHKVCKHCADKTHPFPCQLFLDQGKLRFTLLNGKSDLNKADFTAQARRMAERYALHVNRLLSGRHAVRRMKTDEATVGVFIAKWFYRDWTPSRPHRSAIKDIELKPRDGGYLVHVTFSFGGNIFVLGLEATMHSVLPTPSITSSAETANVDFDYASMLAEQNVVVTISHIEWVSDAPDKTDLK